MNAAQVDTLAAHYGIGSITNVWGRPGDTVLTNMYTYSGTPPWSTSFSLVGGYYPNTWQQNHYFTVVGTGASVSFAASSTGDVSLALYQAGQRVAFSDSTVTGAESFSYTLLNATTYVVVVTGFASAAGSYSVGFAIR